MAQISTEKLALQLSEQRRSVDFDTFDIQLQELLRMLGDEQISVAPVYQRHFRWDPVRCSQLIESLALGIPIPNLFMATNTDNTWEVVDGVQRLSAVAKFAGSEQLRSKLKVGQKLVLTGLEKLSHFNDLTFDDFPLTCSNTSEHALLRLLSLTTKATKFFELTCLSD